MTEVIIAENINISNEENYKYIIEMVDINTLLFNIMNTDTGINYKLYIKKDSEWYKENMYKFQNDFSQLYQIMNDCIFDSESIFKYDLEEIKDMIKFKIKMKQNTKFFKLELDYKLERYISENGSTYDKVVCLEYQFNIYKDKTTEIIQKLQDDNDLLKKQVSELVDFKLKLQEQNKKQYNWIISKWDNLNNFEEMKLKWGVDSSSEMAADNLPSTNIIQGQKIFLETLYGNCSGLAEVKCFMKRWFDHHIETLKI
jgi:hypothetical protein